MNAYFGKPHIWLSKCGAARISLYEKFGTTELWFFYDADGNPSGIRYKNGSTTTDYYFVCNWRGDVIRIYDGAGAVVANYNYDAWGNVISVTDANGAAITDSTHIANVNPLRYRGYYYDSETGFYYLQSRYYDPAVKRFINADAMCSTGQGLTGTNMFSYCNSNPVVYSDHSGLASAPEEILSEIVNMVVFATIMTNTVCKQIRDNISCIKENLLESLIQGILDSALEFFISRIPETRSFIEHGGRFSHLGVGFSVESTKTIFGVKAFKNVAKKVGVVSAFAFAVDIAGDLLKYHASAKDMCIAIGISTVALGLSVIVGVSLAGLPVAFGIVGGVVSGVLIAYGEEWAKKKFIGY